MFGFIKKALTKIYTQFTSRIRTLFSANKVDEETLAELEKILISADTGVHTTRIIISNLREAVASGRVAQELI